MRCPLHVTLIVAVAALLISRPGAAQIELDSISPEDSAAAENAVLFQAREPLEVTLQGDWKAFRDDRSEEAEEYPFHLAFAGADGNQVTVPVKLRVRGNWRRQKRNCTFPNYRLNVPKGEVAGTVFEGQDKLKIVRACQDDNDDYQQYVIQEYLAYRVYNRLTDKSFRVRPLRVTYIDTGGKYKTDTKPAFVIEDDDQLAARHRMTILDMQGLQLDMMDPDLMTLTLVFQYLIGNTDWSVSGLHNVKLLVDEQQIPVAVPYDFDWTGIVNARYAKPDPSLKIRRVRDRLWRGYCKPDEIAEIELAPAISRFNEEKDAIYALYRNASGLDENTRQETINYIDDFYETINNDGKRRRELIRKCRK
jgi:hypothetical protein